MRWEDETVFAKPGNAGGLAASGLQEGKQNSRGYEEDDKVLQGQVTKGLVSYGKAELDPDNGGW